MSDETAGGADATARLTGPSPTTSNPTWPQKTPPGRDRGDPAQPARQPGDFAGDPTRESMGIAAPRDTADSSRSDQANSTSSRARASPTGDIGCWCFHGGPENLQFWQALDTALDRQVALTFVDPEGGCRSMRCRTSSRAHFG